MPIFGKTILLFLILFNFRLPIIYNSAILSAILSAIYYVFVRQTIPFFYFFRRYNITILIGLIFVCFITFFITLAHAEIELTLVKSFILQFFLLSVLIFSFPILVEENSNAFEQAISIICHTFALQGLIQLIAFLVPPFGDFLISIKPQNIQVRLFDIYNVYFRGYSLTGSPFFELPAGFGANFILFFRFILIKEQLYTRKVRKHIIFFLLLIGSILSGRTAFVGLSIGICFYLWVMKNPFLWCVGLVKYTIVSGIFLTIIFYCLSDSQKNKITNDILPFAFEFYYTYRMVGKWTTLSTESLYKTHYFSIPKQTVLFGDGIFNDDSNSYYKDTDAGYMRKILYGGIFFAFLLVVYQSLYFFSPLQIAIKRKIGTSRTDFWCFFALFLHLFILEYKATTIGTQHIMQIILILVGSSYMVKFLHGEKIYENNCCIRN